MTSDFIKAIANGLLCNIMVENPDNCHNSETNYYKILTAASESLLVIIVPGSMNLIRTGHTFRNLVTGKVIMQLV